MRILFVCNEYPPEPHGGVGSFVYTLAHKLVEHGHQVHVAGYDRAVRRSATSIEDGVQVLRIHSPFYNSRYLQIGRYDLPAQVLERVALSRQVKAYCVQASIDLVESYDWSGPLWTHPGKPLLVRMHGAHSAHALFERRRSPRFLAYVEKRNLRMADRLVGVSRHISQVTLRAAGLEGRACAVIYNGVDTAVFRPLNVEKNANEVLFAGTVARRKGIYELFAAAPHVLEAAPDARFTIVGRLPAEENARAALTSDLLGKIPPAQRERVEFAGARPYSEMPGWYNRAACAVFPSLAEAFGLTCAEAMACGTPVVMTSRASGPELVEDGVSGLLANPDEPGELAGAILTYLKDQEFQSIISQHAVQRVQERFSLEEALKQNIEQYQAMV